MAERISEAGRRSRRLSSVHKMKDQHSESDYLETLQSIFDHTTGNISRDCPKMIDKILQELNLAEHLQEGKLANRAFLSINLLLKLYEKSCSNDIEIKSDVSFGDILESIKYILKNSSDVSDNNCQQNILSIVDTLFRIAFSQSSPEAVWQLAEFYQFTLKSICMTVPQESFSSNNLIFMLKILSSILNVLSHMSGIEVSSQSIQLFHNELIKLKKMQNTNEFKVFSGLMLYGDDDIAVHTLLFVIPQYINYYKSSEIVEIVWKEISNLLACEGITIKYSRLLLIMCFFFNLCFEASDFKDEGKFISLFFNDCNYWNLIQLSLVGEDPMMRKQGMYLFKKTIDMLKVKDVNVKSFSRHTTDLIFWWDTNFKKESNNIYTEIIVILEFLDEQQTHIVKPIFQVIEKLVEKFLDLSEKGNKIDFSWVILIHEKALMHESTQILKWGLSNFLRLPEIVFTADNILRKTVHLLVSTLNNQSIYYNDGLAVSTELTGFFEKMTKLKAAKLFFGLFAKRICGLAWSPEALFFVVHSLSLVQRHPFWGEEEISEIKKFVSKAFKTHNKTIRSGVQCELLNAIYGLTDEKSVALENALLLLSSFSTAESLKRGCQTWERTLGWLKSAYNEDEAGRILEKHEEGNLEREFSEKDIALTFILFYYAYCGGREQLKYFDTNCFVMKKLSRILLSFKDIDRRLYCDTTAHDHYVSIIRHICEENLSCPLPGPLLKFLLASLSDIIIYIRRQLRQISDLHDFNACQTYIKTFETLLKTRNIYENDWGIINNFLLEMIKDLEQCQNSGSGTPPIKVYGEVMFLRAAFKISFVKIETFVSSFLSEYLLKKVNEPLQRTEGDSGMTRDLQTLWGRINSEFLEAKWQIFEHLINNKAIAYGAENLEKSSNWINNGDLVKLCVEALNVGGYGVLCPVMLILRNVLWRETEADVRGIVSSLWRLMAERRKTEEFKLFIKQFVEMLFQEEFILKGTTARELMKEYVDLIFSDTSLAVVNIFVKHIQKMEITDSSTPLLSYMLGKGVIHGPVQKRDERLTLQVCSHIESFNICSVGDYTTSNEIRGRAFQKILTLDKDLRTHRVFARNLIETLLTMEREANKNKARYFGDSHVHRVKHRLMQALLLLEPVLYPSNDVAEELERWLYRSLMVENPQPSVKYQQEWLLIRLLIRYPDLLHKFWGYFSDSVEKKTKGTCTLIAIAHHLSKLVSPETTASWIDQAIPTILPFCMDQHFEVRLYAQVVLQKLHGLAKARNLSEIIKNYETVTRCVSQSIQRGCKGNAGKNCMKLQEDFYLNSFHPLEHFSLQTIFVELPRLANVGSDEWISVEVFTSCGLDPAKIRSIALRNPDSSLEELDGARWLLEKSHPDAHSEFQKQQSDECVGNYQKKIIPVKTLIPGLDEALSCDSSAGNNKKDGLIVVASLIDRIPNLGGLARTCEIFGASEYIISSLKYLEDKQFASLSVTAEKWITVKEVKSHNLLEYVLDMKAAGYTVIGAEQALYSQPLSSAQFPRKSLLLLGNEREGIPPNLLPLLDICVEIPQVGIIRSLNVHVTGALFIWEYAKQNYFS